MMDVSKTLLLLLTDKVLYEGMCKVAKTGRFDLIGPDGEVLYDGRLTTTRPEFAKIINEGLRDNLSSWEIELKIRDYLEEEGLSDKIKRYEK